MSFYETNKVREAVTFALSEARMGVDKCREQSFAVMKLEEADMWLRVVEDRQRQAEQDADDIPF